MHTLRNSSLSLGIVRLKLLKTSGMFKYWTSLFIIQQPSQAGIHKAFIKATAGIASFSYTINGTYWEKFFLLLH